MAFTRTADANLDGVVNDDDVTIVGASYAPGVAGASWAVGDFDYNGFVDDDDVTLLGVLYDPGAPPLAAAAGSAGFGRRRSAGAGNRGTFDGRPDRNPGGTRGGQKIATRGKCAEIRGVSNAAR